MTTADDFKSFDGSEPASKKLRTRRFKVNRKFDGAKGMTIEIIVGGQEPLIRVRLKHRRAAIEVLLGDVAEWILVRDARARAAEKAKARKEARAKTSLRGRKATR